MPIGKVAAFFINLAVVGGGMALQYLLTPRQRGIPSDQGKLDDIRLTGSEYGTLIPRVWGMGRMGSNLIWSSGIRHEIINMQSGGGKGATPASATTTHVYKADIGLQICRGPIQKVGRIWADSDIITSTTENSGMAEAELVDFDAGASVISSVVASGGAYISAFSYIDFTADDIYFIKKPRLDEVTTEYDAVSFLTIYYKCSGTVKLRIQLYSDADPTVTGLIYDEVVTLTTTTDSWQPHMVRLDRNDNIHIGRVKLSKDGSNAIPDIDRIALTKEWRPSASPATTIYTPSTGFIDPFLTIDDTALDAAPYYNYHPPYDVNGVSSGDAVASIPNIYTGTSSQSVDDFFITWLDGKYGVGMGVDFAMAYRDTVVAVLGDYNLRGGRIPNYTFEIYTEVHTFGDMLPALLEECGLSATDYDISAIEDIEFVGIVETSKQSKKAFLENLGVYFGFRMYEADGKLKFVTDEDFSSDGTVSSDLLRARAEDGEMKPYDAELLSSPKGELPREMRFNIMNPLLDYHNETIVASLYADMASANAQEVNFPIIDYPANARLYCEKALLRTYAQTKTVTFSAMPEILQYALGDIVTITLNEIEFKIRIEKMTIGMPIGVVEVEGAVIEEYNPSEVFVSVTQQSTTTDAMKTKLVNLRNAKAIPIVSLPIRGRDKGRLGCYIAVTPIGSGVTDNIALYRELGADNYMLLDALDVPAKCGVTDGTLGSHANAAVEDTTNTLDIYFYNTTSLESFTAAELTRYPTLNLIRVGNEWIQFRTAVAQSLPSGSNYRSKWRISNLQRGRYSTSGAMSGHAASEDCVLWEDTLRFYDLNEEDIGETVTLKVTTGGQLVEDAKAFDFTFNPVSKYTVTNDSADRAYDANSTSINELADVVATIIDDLKI